MIAFVDALDQITPIKDRFAGAFGGSLGANLGLRLGRQSPMPPWLDAGIVSWNAASVWTDHTRKVPFSSTVDECVDFIDFGCDVFVTRAGGGRAAVHVVRKQGVRPYIATAPDASGENNLLLLPTC